MERQDGVLSTDTTAAGLDTCLTTTKSVCDEFLLEFPYPRVLNERHSHAFLTDLVPRILPSTKSSGY